MVPSPTTGCCGLTLHPLSEKEGNRVLKTFAHRSDLVVGFSSVREPIDLCNLSIKSSQVGAGTSSPF